VSQELLLSQITQQVIRFGDVRFRPEDMKLIEALAMIVNPKDLPIRDESEKGMA
jgi:hypothetical protein